MTNFDLSPTSTPKRGLNSLTETLGLIHGADYNPEQCRPKAGRRISG